MNSKVVGTIYPPTWYKKPEVISTKTVVEDGVVTRITKCEPGHAWGSNPSEMKPHDNRKSNKYARIRGKRG